MGAERLRIALALGLALVALGCHGAPTDAQAPRAAAITGKHFQVVRALTTPERKAIVARFRERNPGETWSFNEAALEASLVVVDPFRGFLRRGRSAHVTGEHGVNPEAAVTAARAFVEKNAELLGVPLPVVYALAEDAGASPEGWSVRLTATYPSKGYEAFREVDNQVDLEVTVADDGVVRAFQNRSRIHPPLVLDIHPALGADNPALVQKLLGRQLFALAGSGGGSRDVRALARIPLGAVRPEDVVRVQLAIHVSPGPGLAWIGYRLAYTVIVGKSFVPAGMEPFFGVGGAGPSFFFRYIVDADTGEVLEDARAPITEPEGEEP